MIQISSTTRSFNRIPAGQSNTVAVSVQNDPRQNAIGLFFTYNTKRFFPSFVLLPPKEYMAEEEGGQRIEPAGQASVDGILEPSRQFTPKNNQNGERKKNIINTGRKLYKPSKINLVVYLDKSRKEPKLNPNPNPIPNP